MCAGKQPLIPPILSPRDGQAAMNKRNKQRDINRNEGSSSPTHFEVMLGADVNTISPVVALVMRLVGDLKYAEGKEFEIEMALREALANAVLHGCKGDPTKQIECSVSGDKDRGISIMVRDPGEGFDVSNLACPTTEQNLFSDHGRGIYLINNLMDEVKYERNGSEIHMRKY
jgi:serine/threonine-protein kinase RsbW